MTATIELSDLPRGEAEQWILQNVGPRLHWLHNSVGGQGWIIKRDYPNKGWKLTFEDEKLASYYRLKFG